ncbi:MAG: DUF2203 domain-containing protein [Candidatus Binatia bacterium]
MPYLHAKHFTLGEAQDLVARVRPLVEEMVEMKRRLDERGFDIARHQHFGGVGPNGDRYFPRDLERLVEILKELDALGIQVKGIDQGLIDFPHLRRNGEEVYLCFRAGEPEITAWHSIEAGFAGRRPLAEL